MVKQVIVVRKDLNMRKGKIGAQCAHASMKIFFDRMRYIGKGSFDDCAYQLEISKEMDEWFNGIFTKIVVYVESEEELFSVYDEAKKAGLPCSLIKDNGLTEFNGVHTYTCVGIGPAEASKIDAITGHLRLY